MNNERLLFSDLRVMAIKAGIPDNKIAIGLWIKQKRWVKHHSTDKNRKGYYYYTKL